LPAAAVVAAAGESGFRSVDWEPREVRGGMAGGANREMKNEDKDEADRPPPRRSRYVPKPNSLETIGRPGWHGHGCDSFVLESTPPGIGALGKMATGFKELVLVPALMEQELTVREARAVIDAVFGSIKDALGRHESVDLPIGNFTVLQNPDERRSWRFRKITILYAHRYRLKFLPSAELNLAAAAAPPSSPRPKRKKKLSPLEISTQLIVDFICKNVEADRWNFFFHEFSNPDPFMLAMFERNRPKLHELRPLDAAVIDECAPKVMPENPRDHLKVCLEWFVYWSRRVIPIAVYPEAMQQAKKTLLPQDLFRTLDGR
jgi:nucleoid DNA-binding protein